MVEVFGPVVDDSGEALGEALRHASADGPVELRYVGVTSFNEQLEDRLARGNPPDIVLLPQPGVLADLSRRGLLEPLPGEVEAESRATIPPGLLDLVTVDGRPAAVWLNVDVKGLVWYRPAVFADRALTPPATLDELAVLADAIRTAGDGVAPWCVTAEAGAATGWVGTDWVEGYLLRRLGPDAYDRWTSGSMAFDDPQVATVFDELDLLLRQPGAVAGGVRAVLDTPWEHEADGLFEDPPRCLMAHQADFLRREFAPGARIDPDGDVDFFVLPSAQAGRTPPLLLGGTIAAPLRGGPEVAAALAVLAGRDLAERLDRTGDFLSPHLGVDRAAITDPTARRLLDLLEAAELVRFDGSDLMPGEVGTGSFWAGMRSFFGGESVDVLLAEIQAAWPAGTDTDTR